MPLFALQRKLSSVPSSDCLESFRGPKFFDLLCLQQFAPSLFQKHCYRYVHLLILLFLLSVGGIYKNYKYSIKPRHEFLLTAELLRFQLGHSVSMKLKYHVALEASSCDGVDVGRAALFEENMIEPLRSRAGPADWSVDGESLALFKACAGRHIAIGLSQRERQDSSKG